MKLACGLVLTHFKTIKYSKVERPAYSLHHCAVLKILILDTDGKDLIPTSI